MGYQFFLGLAVFLSIASASVASDSPEPSESDQDIDFEYRVRDWMGPVARPFGSSAALSLFEWGLYQKQLQLRPHELRLVTQTIEQNPSHLVVPFRDLITVWHRDDYMAWKKNWDLLTPGVVRDAHWERRIKNAFQKILLTDEGNLRGVSAHAQAVTVATILNRDYLEAKSRWVNEAEDALLMASRDRREAARLVMERLSEVTNLDGDLPDGIYLQVRELVEAMGEGDLDRAEDVSAELLDVISSLTGESFSQHLAGIDPNLSLNVLALDWDDVASTPTVRQQENLLRLALFSTLVEKGVFFDTEGVGFGLQFLNLAERSFLALYPELMSLWKWVVALQPQMSELAVGSEDGDESLLDFNRFELAEVDLFEFDRHQVEAEFNHDENRELAVTLRFTPLGNGQTDSLFLSFLVQTLVDEAEALGIAKSVVARAHIDPDTGVFFYKLSQRFAPLGMRLAVALKQIFQSEARLNSLRADYGVGRSTANKRYLRRLLRDPLSTKSCASWLRSNAGESLAAGD